MEDSMTAIDPGPAEGNRRFLASVNVYGAGIAGLSAAHELIERGFRVRIIEYDRAIGPDGDEGPAIGGLARNQYVRAPKLLSPRWWEIDADAIWTAEESDDALLPIYFDRQSAELTDEARTSLQRAATAIQRKFGMVGVQISSSARDAKSPKQNRTLGAARAEAIKATLRDALPGMTDEHFAVIEDEALYETSDERGVAMVGIVKVILPGEHGFHFFPGYYRHLFDTMRRTPILDDHGRETTRTVYDNLTVAPDQSFAVESPQPTSPDESQDYLQVAMRLQRYLVTSPARRAAELEDISWWQYLQGWNPATGVPLYIYSPAFAQNVKFSGRVLAAFDAEWGDARTNGDTYIQLQMNTWTGGKTFDGILNGGETDAWFLPWRRYLESRGVTFVNARLQGFEVEGGVLRAMVTPWGADTAVADDDADYFISATDVASAETVTSKLPAIGVPGSLRGYTTIVAPFPPLMGEADPAWAREKIVRDPLTQPGLRYWDRLQTLSGIQYFFANEFKLVSGYMYFTDAPWALSSINPQQFWTHRPTLETDGYVSVMSVDIGDWRAPSRTPTLLGRTAWNCTEEEIAREVWRQVTTSLLRNTPDLILPQPVWYNVDQNIVFGKPPSGTPRKNHTPYQIPIVGDWKRRPVGDPWDPTPTLTNLNGPIAKLPSGVTQAKHGGYLVHWDKLVFAGTYMRTFTRMTTMESANESARHAVNAVIDHLVDKRYWTEVVARVAPATANAGEPNLNSNFTREFPRPSPVGDYCRIWNPEENELPSASAARDEDAIRFACGLPHIWDVLGIELPASTASYQRAILKGWWPPPFDPDAAARVAAAMPTTESLFESLARIRQTLEDSSHE
jgi:outer membrane protein OmpA-like peptidoglycan-associated protein